MQLRATEPIPVDGPRTADDDNAGRIVVVEHGPIGKLKRSCAAILAADASADNGLYGSTNASHICAASASAATLWRLK